MLELAIRHRQGDFTLAADLTLGEGLTALFGASGSGKTTLINMIAGLIRSDARRASCSTVDTARRIFVPAHRRRFGYVFQEARLFPHLTVRQNLNYGRWFSPKASRRPRPHRHLAWHLRPAHPPPGKSLRRRKTACGPRPRPDGKPEAAVDGRATLRSRQRPEGADPALYRAHPRRVRRADPLCQPFRRGGRAARQCSGHLCRWKSAGRWQTRRGLGDRCPRFRRSSGWQFHRGRDHRSDEEDGLTEALSPAGPLLLRRTHLPIGTRVRVFVPVSDIVVATEPGEGLSALNRLSGHVVAVAEGSGGSATITVDCQGQTMVAEVTRRSLRQLALAPGKPVHLLFKTVSIASEGLFRRSLG